MEAARAIVAIILTSVVVNAYAAVPGAPKAPICEKEPNPTDVTDYSPEFGWIFRDPDSGDVQSAYQILVASNLPNLENNNGDM